MEVHTNHAAFKGGVLKVAPCHVDHGCELICPDNMCKGKARRSPCCCGAISSNPQYCAAFDLWFVGLICCDHEYIVHALECSPIGTLVLSFSLTLNSHLLGSSGPVMTPLESQTPAQHEPVAF